MSACCQRWCGPILITFVCSWECKCCLHAEVCPLKAEVSHTFLHLLSCLPFIYMLEDCAESASRQHNVDRNIITIASLTDYFWQQKVISWYQNCSEPQKIFEIHFGFMNRVKMKYHICWIACQFKYCHTDQNTHLTSNICLVFVKSIIILKRITEQKGFADCKKESQLASLTKVSIEKRRVGKRN